MSPFGEMRNYAANSQAIQGGSGPIGYQETAKREESGLMRELQYMDKNLSALMCSIDLLHNILAPVLLPQSETTPGLRNGPASDSSLTMQLASFNGILSDQLTRLDSLTQGLDL